MSNNEFEIFTTNRGLFEVLFYPNKIDKYCINVLSLISIRKLNLFRNGKIHVEEVLVLITDDEKKTFRTSLCSYQYYFDNESLIA